MKKILGLTTLLLCLLGTQTALADFTLSEPSNDLEVSVNCADMGNAGVSVSVFGDGASEVEPAFVYQTKGTADGAYLVDMQLSSNASGNYTVSVFDIEKKYLKSCLYNYSPRRESKCLDCEYLFICRGGCPGRSLDNNMWDGDYLCPIIKDYK